MNNIFAVCTFVSIEAKTNTEDGWISKNIQRNLQMGWPKAFNEIIWRSLVFVVINKQVILIMYCHKSVHCSVHMYTWVNTG